MRYTAVKASCQDPQMTWAALVCSVPTPQCPNTPKMLQLVCRESLDTRRMSKSTQFEPIISAWPKRPRSWAPLGSWLGSKGMIAAAVCRCLDRGQGFCGDFIKDHFFREASREFRLTFCYFAQHPAYALGMRLTRWVGLISLNPFPATDAWFF